METSPKMCRCGHDRSVHEHYRRGDDCGACGSAVCAAFAMAADDNVVHFRRLVVRRLRARGIATTPVAVLATVAEPVVEAPTSSAV